MKGTTCTSLTFCDLLQVSYHDVPDKAYESFVNALTMKYLEKGLIIPSLVEVHNPAGLKSENFMITWSELKLYMQ